MLFGPLYPTVGLKCQSGALEDLVQRAREGPTSKIGRPLYLKVPQKIWRGGVSLDCKTFSAIVTGRSDLERRAAGLSKSQARCPVEL